MVDQTWRCMRLVASENDFSPGSLKVVELDLLREQDIAQRLALLVNPEGNAEGDDRSWGQGADGLVDGLMHRTRSARTHLGDGVKHRRAVDRAEIVIKPPFK